MSVFTKKAKFRKSRGYVFYHVWQVGDNVPSITTGTNEKGEPVGIMTNESGIQSDIEPGSVIVLWKRTMIVFTQTGFDQVFDPIESVYK